MNHFNAESTTDAGDNLQAPSPTHLPPEVREWLLKQSNEEEIVADLQELRATGGVQLRA